MITANRFLVTDIWYRIFKQKILNFLMLFVPVMGMWTSSIGIVGFALNPQSIRLCISRDKSSRRSRVRDFHTKCHIGNILLNEGMLGCHLLTNHTKTLYSQRKYYLVVMLINRVETSFVRSLQIELTRTSSGVLFNFTETPNNVTGGKDKCYTY
ncbi:MAG: hypothetical protein CM15mV13_1340 [uncultured marine virus]|nr:MAG: hypothetical protein CM15mV13_1340 [uncultured marine virus]